MAIRKKSSKGANLREFFAAVIGKCLMCSKDVARGDDFVVNGLDQVICPKCYPNYSAFLKEKRNV